MVWVIRGRLMFTYFHILELEKVPSVHMKKDQHLHSPSVGRRITNIRESREVKQCELALPSLGYVKQQNAICYCLLNNRIVVATSHQVATM